MAMSDELDPPIGPRWLTRAERQARDQGEQVDALLEPIARPRMAAHLTASREVLDAIESVLDHMLQTTDLDPQAPTRAAALWLLMGRCVGQQRAVLALVELGMAVEAQPLGRAIIEMTNIVTAIAAGGPVGEKLAQQWIADGDAYVKAQAARRGVAISFDDRAADERVFRPLDIKSLDDAEKRIYDYFGRASHGRRASTLESYYSPTRSMARGGRYALLDQVLAVEWASSSTERVVRSAMTMLLPFYGQNFVMERIVPLYERIEAIRREQPLAAKTVAAQARVRRYPFWPAAAGE